MLQNLREYKDLVVWFEKTHAEQILEREEEWTQLFLEGKVNKPFIYLSKHFFEPNKKRGNAHELD
jgi:hypothetical protein